MVRGSVEIEILEYDGVFATVVSVKGLVEGRSIDIPRFVLPEPMYPHEVRRIEVLIRQGAYRLAGESGASDPT